MNRYVIYRDISPGYVVVDTLTDRVVALYNNRALAERAAERLNAVPFAGRVHVLGEVGR
jgi:hypothetical protein